MTAYVDGGGTYLSARITVSPPKSNQRLWKSESKYGWAKVSRGRGSPTGWDCAARQINVRERDCEFAAAFNN
jgi:hypothetical protein